MKIIKCSITQGYIFIVRIIIFTETCEYQSICVAVLAFENIKVNVYALRSPLNICRQSKVLRHKLGTNQTVFSKDISR